MSLICAKLSRCWRPAARCGPASCTGRRASGRCAAGRGAGVGIATPRSGSPRPAGWRSCGPGLAAAEEALAAGRPSITVGGKRLWRTRNHLDAGGHDRAAVAGTLGRRADVSDRRRRIGQGRRQRNHPRRRGGPAAYQSPGRPGRPVRHPCAIAAPVRFTHRGQEWAARVAARRAVRYDITSTLSEAAGIWTPPGKPPPNRAPAARRAARRAGAGRRSQCRPSGLLCARTARATRSATRSRSTCDTAGLAASRRDGRVRAAITALLDHAEQQDCSAVVVENLNFADARATGRETLGRGNAGNDFAAPWPGSPPRSSAPGSPRWPPAAASR